MSFKTKFHLRQLRPSKTHFIFKKIYSEKRLLSSINGKSVLQQKTFIKKKEPTMNQHPPARNEGWMVSGQETVFCWVPAP